MSEEMNDYDFDFDSMGEGVLLEKGTYGMIIESYETKTGTRDDGRNWCMANTRFRIVSSPTGENEGKSVTKSIFWPGYAFKGWLLELGLDDVIRRFSKSHPEYKPLVLDKEHNSDGKMVLTQDSLKKVVDFVMTGQVEDAEGEVDAECGGLQGRQVTVEVGDQQEYEGRVVTGDFSAPREV